jgi:hypothetical protein
MASIIRTDALQNLNTSNIITQTNATTITVGATGQTISIPAGATLTNNGTASGFGLTWQSVQTTGFTAVKGNAYPCNTTSAGFTVTLPATPSAGDQVQVVDYAGTFDTNSLILNPNGNKLESGTDNLALTGEREGVILTYIDSTQGWLASSGINEGTDALSPAPYSANYLVAAGGGSGGSNLGGGGGAGGLLTGTASITVGAVYTITVGAGGAGDALSGSNSSISGTGLTTITSTGGGGGGEISAPNQTGKSGGSGGGGSANYFSGSPPTGGSGTSGQGNTGGTGAGGGTQTVATAAGGGGGGSSAVGSNAVSSTGGNGGNGTASSITGSSVTYAGGGGGGSGTNTSSGGTGGGGAGGGGGTVGVNGTANTGGGGGGGGNPGTAHGNGGSGVVILSVPTASYSGTSTGSPTVTTSGSNTILKFTGSGSYTG